MKKAGKWIGLTVAHTVAALLYPVVATKWLNGFGSWRLWPFYALVYSAIVFYSADWFEGHPNIRYLKSVLFQGVICTGLGFAGAALKASHVHIHTGTCFIDGGNYPEVIPMMSLDMLIQSLPSTVLFVVLRKVSDWIDGLKFLRDRKIFQNNLKAQSSMPKHGASN